MAAPAGVAGILHRISCLEHAKLAFQDGTGAWSMCRLLITGETVGTIYARGGKAVRAHHSRSRRMRRACFFSACKTQIYKISLLHGAELPGEPGVTYVPVRARPPGATIATQGPRRSP